MPALKNQSPANPPQLGGFVAGSLSLEDGDDLFHRQPLGFGLAWVMVLFAGLAVVAIVFVARFLPETKGLSVEEVVTVFQGQAAGDKAA